MNELEAILKKIGEDHEKTTQQGTAEAYERLLSVFEELNDFAREKIQQITLDDMTAIVDKLKNGLAITPEDKDQIRLWIVGDAEEYAAAVSRQDKWRDELGGLIVQMKELRNEADGLAAYSRFRALLREASRRLSDIAFFQHQKERVDKFHEAIGSMEAEQRAILIRILEQKIKSPDY